MTPSTKTPAQLLREKLAKRSRKAMIEAGNKIGRLTPSQKITPSQRKSENAKRRDAKRAGTKHIAVHYPCDCWKCQKEPCGKSLEQCEEKSMVHRCKKCGQSVRHRVDANVPWESCPGCIGEVR